MAWKILEKIKRHSAVASGDFGTMFRNVRIPPLPASAVRLISVINQSEPDTDRVVKILSSSPEIAVRILKTVNSSFYALGNPITSIRQAVALLGLKRIKSIALTYTMMDSIPKPGNNLFNHEAFWIDSMVRAILARTYTGLRHGSEEDEAFTSALLADVAVPILISGWEEYYSPVLVEWQSCSDRLSTVERREFGWDHAQAGAWILQTWRFPEGMVCLVGAHNLSHIEIKELGLEETIAVPMAVASLTPSVVRPDPNRALVAVEEAVRLLKLSRSDYCDLLASVRGKLSEVLTLFSLPDAGATDILDLKQSAAEEDVAGEDM